MKTVIKFDGPILDGSVSTAESRCGKPACICKAKPPKLHGTYYRWTGTIRGKRTTKTISAEVARECKKRIARYRSFKKQVDLLLAQALLDAPWESNARKKETKT